MQSPLHATQECSPVLVHTLPCIGNREQNSLDDVLLVVPDIFEEVRDVVIVQRKSLLD